MIPERCMLALALALLALVPSVRAEAKVEVRSDVPSRVYFDEELTGDTPLVLDNIPAGTHKIWIENAATGEIKVYAVLSPASVRVEKTVEATFQPSGTPPRQVVVLPEERAPRVWTTSGPSYRVPRPVVYSTPVSTPVVVSSTRTRSQKEKAKVHTRNTLLGLTAASQIFTGDKRDRKRYRNVGVGLTVLNEILR